MNTQHIALALFLILVTIGIIIFLTVTILLKRRIARRKSRIERNKYTSCGYRLPKVYKESIERHLNATIRVRTEPEVFCSYYADNFENHLKDGKINFLYRAKCLDDFLQLKRSILTVADLEAPPMIDIRAFLMAARRNAMHPPAPKDQIEQYCQLYLRARHDIDAFGEEDYIRSSELQKNLMKHVLGSRTTDLATSDISDQLTSSHSSRLFKYHRIPSATLSKPHSDATSRSYDAFHSEQSTSRQSKTISKSSNTLKRFTYTRCKGSDFLPSSSDVRQCDEVVEIENPTFQNLFADDAVAENQPSTSVTRRNSCRSDGSQTALIDIDPMFASPKSTRFTRSNETSGLMEMKPIGQRSKDVSGMSIKGVSGSSGMSNQGVNC